ncbi:MAG: hypothetical protein LQ352_005777, partial [Teloschistes flavicans]
PTAPFALWLEADDELEEEGDGVGVVVVAAAAAAPGCWTATLPTAAPPKLLMMASTSAIPSRLDDVLPLELLVVPPLVGEGSGVICKYTASQKPSAMQPA